MSTRLLTTTLPQVWLPTDKNMVGCDSCPFWIHDHCDPMAAKLLRSTKEQPYHCPSCRQAKSHESKLAALREAEEAVRAAQPRKPRSAYQLFAAEIHK